MEQGSSAFFQNSWALGLWAVALAFVFAEVFLKKQISLSTAFRVLWISSLAWLVGDWTFVQNSKWSQPEAIKVFIDRSDSIAKLPERKSVVENMVKEIRAWSTEKRLPLRIYSFADHLLEESDGVQWGSFSSLIQPIEEVASAQEGVNILISDGLWTDRARFRSPTYVLGVGSESERDIWVERIQPVFTAFLKNRLKVPVVVGQKGFEGKRISVELWISGEKNAETEVKLSGSETSIDFSYFPERMGEQTGLIKIASVDGELSSLNNEVPFKIRTVRDKIRVLHVCGKPSLDLKAWRAFLTRQPDVDLVSFYILRTLNDDPEAKNSELSLIPFPYEDLFSTELEKFDVVILQNFDFNLYFPPFYLANLARFVSQGGSLMMIGGDQGFDRYQNSPLDPLMPFTFGLYSDFEEKISSLEISQTHPILSGLEADFKLPTWTARHRISTKSAAATLLRFQHSDIPFFALRDVDKGRILAINSDELWKLQMQPFQRSPVFGKLARRILQYLTFDPEMNPKTILTSAWKVGQEVQIELANHEKTNWKLRSLAFEPLTARWNNESQIHFRVPFPGVFEATADAVSEQSLFLTEEQPWTGEWRHLVADHQKLKEVAQESGGKFFTVDRLKELLDQPLSGRQMVSARTSSWSHQSSSRAWIFLICAILFLCADFYFRKRNHWDL